MAFLRRSLDDPDPTPCGKCSSCVGQPIINQIIDPALVHRAGTFLKHAEMPITPKAQVAANAFYNMVSEAICLSRLERKKVEYCLVGGMLVGGA